MIDPAFLMPLLTLKSNGGGIVAMELARSMAKAEFKITILTSNYYGTSIINLAENSNINFLIVPSFGGKYVSASLLILWGIVYSIKKKPILLYTHIVTSFIPNFAAQRAIWVAQDIEYRFFNGMARSLFKRILRRVSRVTDVMITSDWLGRYYRRIGANIIFCHDIGPSKGAINYFLAHNTSISHKNNDVLLIAKYGAHKRGLESQALAKKLASTGLRVILVNQMGDWESPSFANLRVVGSISHGQMLEFLSNTKVLVNLSRFEGFGLVPLEALLVGCMVVSTKTPSISKYRGNRLKMLNGSSLELHDVVEAVKVLISQSDNNPGVDFDNIFYLEDWAFNAAKSFKSQLRC